MTQGSGKDEARFSTILEVSLGCLDPNLQQRHTNTHNMSEVGIPQGRKFLHGELSTELLFKANAG